MQHSAVPENMPIYSRQHATQAWRHARDLGWPASRLPSRMGVHVGVPLRRPLVPLADLQRWQRHRSKLRQLRPVMQSIAVSELQLERIITMPAATTSDNWCQRCCESSSFIHCRFIVTPHLRGPQPPPTQGPARQRQGRRRRRQQRRSCGSRILFLIVAAWRLCRVGRRVQHLRAASHSQHGYDALV